MPTNETRLELLNRAKASGYPGSITEVFQAADQGIDLIEQFTQQQQQQQIQVANTPQEQAVGLREQHAMGNTDASMAFPNVQPGQSFNTVGMQAPIDIQKVDNQGHLVESYKNVPPGIQDLPTGPSEGTIIESPASYQKGGFNFNKKTDYSQAAINERNKNRKINWGGIETVLGFGPGSGEVIDAKNTIQDLRSGDYVGAAANAAGFVLPFVPGKLVKKGVNTLRKKWHKNPNPKSLLETNKTVDQVITQGKKDIEGMVTNNPNKIPVSNISGSNITNKGDIGNLGPYKRPSGRDLVDVEISPGTNVQMYRSTGGGNKYFADGRTSQGFYSPYLGSMDGTLNTSRGTRFIPDWQVKTKGWDKGYGSDYVKDLGHKLKNIDETETLTEINKIVDKGGPISPAFDPTEQHPFIYRKKGGFQNGGFTPYSFDWLDVNKKRKKKDDRNLFLQRQRYAESTFDPKAVSDAGAMGIAQFMPITIQEMKNKNIVSDNFDPFDAMQATKAQKKWMKYLSERPYINKGTDEVKLAKQLAGYNMGGPRLFGVLKAMKKDGINIYDDLHWVDKLPEYYLDKKTGEPITETTDYINKILNKTSPTFERDFEKATTTEFYKPKRKGGIRRKCKYGCW